MFPSDSTQSPQHMRSPQRLPLDDELPDNPPGFPSDAPEADAREAYHLASGVRTTGPKGGANVPASLDVPAPVRRTTSNAEPARRSSTLPPGAWLFSR